MENSGLQMMLWNLAPKSVRSPKLDNLVLKQNKIRFLQKLKTLLLSKPKHYIPLHILSKCRSYLALPENRSIRTMIYSYLTIFKLFHIPMPPSPLNATKSGYHVLKRHHRNFLIMFGELQTVCPYNTSIEEFAKESRC
ncbi:hypothetical protein Dsin_001281 [Dipteronia sinensis]|uniref:PORR domain-containing protein n=1 Tax=Dipteronia sinensis TaxID=43782 RepID=A0AAE0B505_9ROSI|nr:hypothetical protein Dsin_001281 [Dipteronia sinensis]